MFKKTWLASISVAMAAFCCSSVALAEDYYGNNYNCPNGNCNYNSNDYYGPAPLPIATPAPMSPWYGAGFIIGIQGGVANTHWNNLNLTDPIDGVDNITFNNVSGGAGRLYIGYDFNRYIGIELGGVILPKTTVNILLDPDATLGISKAPTITNYAGDLLPVITVPVVGGLNFHAKAGLGVFSSKSSTVTVVDNVDGTTSNFSQSATHVGPAFGAGIGYEIIPNLILAIDWMRYSGNGKVQNTTVPGSTSTKNGYQPSPDLGLIGLQYKFPVRIS